jgi:3-hydroxyisobutyrate dehydrogenase-like beta-hydroxyacid dehydrogenase
MDNATVMGLGKMGRALVSALGPETTAWNRTPGRGADLPFVRAATAEDAVAANELVIVCLLDFQSVVEVLDGLDLTGRAIVNLTTGTPAEAAELAALVTERGGSYLDGGIMAIPSMVGTEAALVLYSGSREVFERWEPVLSRLGGTRYLGAEPGMAALNDIAMLTGMYGMMGGFVHAAALVRSEGVPVAEFTGELLIPWLRAMFPALTEMAEQIDKGDYQAKESTLSM